MIYTIKNTILSCKGVEIIKLDYFTLLNPDPVPLTNIGNIRAPTLRDISKIGYMKYYSHIHALLTNLHTYYSILDKYGDLYFQSYTQEQKMEILQLKSTYESMNMEDRGNLSFFDVIALDDNFIHSICDALNFFMTDTIVFDKRSKVFLTYDNITQSNDCPTGIIYSQNYDELIHIILQRINISPDLDHCNASKVKNPIAAKLLKKIQKGSEKEKKQTDKKMEIPNLISSLASHSNSINILNIWDLTVYQLYDQFNRQRIDDTYDIQSMSVAAWGNSDGKFDDTIWFSPIHEN